MVRRPRLVLVHGSVTGGRPTWAAQRRGLAEHFDLLVLERRGFPPGPPVERVDFEDEAAWLLPQLRSGDHLVGHSYGGVIALLAAAGAGEILCSLTVIEPPATRAAAGRSAADDFGRQGAEWWAGGPRDDPEAFLRGFLGFVGAGFEPPSPLPPELEQGAQLLIGERGPWEAEIPLEELARAPYPKLVVSGAHHEAFDAICDALESRLGAERLVLPGFGHSPQRHPDFNHALARFVERASAASG
ncbi:MAG TPA: alpha/beta hydrolase [Gaiellaceae bacterium]|nr:alpha/beta hydrolase [Gaiellaceae bacterium]